MCGLFGYIAQNASDPALVARGRAARDTLSHRGPDQAGEWHDARLYIAHRRLSILDVSDAGRQPMVDDNGDIVVTANGEIYNFQSLRDELRAVGAVFSSGSDSEVLLHGYRYWGLDALLDKIDGIYAFALYDRRAGELILGRDRAGVKPLYYALAGTTLVWASELKAIKRFLSDGMPAYDETALYDFLTYSYIPSPKTLYKNIYKVPPASVVRVNTATLAHTVGRYWNLQPSETGMTDAEIAASLRGLMARSVSEQMAADVPVGFFLSGGIDSAIVTGVAAGMGERIRTYSIGFDDGQADETSHAQAIAAHFGTHHSVRHIAPDPDMDFIPWLGALYDEPLATNSALPTWHVAGMARRDVTVALTGDGGDELFGGYTWYGDDRAKIALCSTLSRLPDSFWHLPLPRRKGLRHYAQAVGRSRDPLMIYNNLYFTKIHGARRARYKQALNIPRDYDDMWFFRPYYRPELGPRKWRQYLDFHTFLPEMVLAKVDRASMAHGLEARVPFLSRALIEFAFCLPERFLYKDGQLKGGLKWAFRDLLPESILMRPKQGFSVPWDAWRGRLIGEHVFLQEALLSHFQDVLQRGGKAS